MTASMSRRRDVAAFLGSLITLLALLIGVPAALALLAGWPLPHALPSVAEVRRALDNGWSPDGLFVYTEKGREEVLMSEEQLRAGEIKALVDAVKQEGPGFPDVRWGRATLEACIAMKTSGQLRKEIMMEHQVASPLRPTLLSFGGTAPRFPD